MKYSPGPWKLVSAGVGFRRPTERTNDMAIQAADGICPGIVWDITVLEQKQNALLIAAAPEMYEAAKNIISIYESHNGDHYSNEISMAEAMKQLRIAIAKAEGELPK